MELPSPNLTWSHSTCSVKALNKALADKEISAIEVDIVMGYVNNTTPHENKKESQDTIIPIMAHPPLKESDLSMKNFLYHTTYSQSFSDKGEFQIQRKLQKHIKLDFKEMDTIQPTLDTIKNMDICFDGKESTVFLNADILPGPAMRVEGTVIDCDIFLQMCIQYVNEDRPYALSLGWRTDCRSFTGYMQSDVNAMMDLFRHYKLNDKFSGVVLAVNARVLVKNFKPLQQILSEFPKCQMLVWTANGEPAIPESKINSIQQYFEKFKMIDRVGFDCKITPSMWHGIWCDFLVSLSSIYFHLGKCKHLFSFDRWDFNEKKKIK